MNWKSKLSNSERCHKISRDADPIWVGAFWRDEFHESLILKRMGTRETRPSNNPLNLLQPQLLQLVAMAAAQCQLGSVTQNDCVFAVEERLKFLDAFGIDDG